jgi:DNA-binding MarR family transcriptional regulator
MTMYDYRFAGMSLTAFAHLRQMWIAMNKVVEIRLREIGATPESMTILWACRDLQGPVRPAELARLVFRSPHTVAGILRWMEEEGLVVRMRRRPGHPFTEVKLTPKGKKACSPAIETAKDVIAEIMSVMSDEELEQLVALTRPLQLKVLKMLQVKLKSSPPGTEQVTMPTKTYERREKRRSI